MLRIFEFFKRIRLSKNARIDLDILANQAPAPIAPLRIRMLWLVELIQWIRLEGNVHHQLDFQSGEPQAVRVKYLLQVLNRNPEWHAKVSLCLGSIIQDTNSVDLLLNAGIPERESFLGEFVDRSLKKVLPSPPHNHDLGFLFNEYLNDPQDVAWISSIDADSFRQLIELFRSSTYLKRDVKDALLLLAVQIRAAGLSMPIRQRIESIHFTELPFYKLPIEIEKLVSVSDSDMQLATSDKIEKLIADCFLSLEQVHNHLNEYGVNISIVYAISKLETQLERMRILNFILTQKVYDHQLVSRFVVHLIAANSKRHSLRALLGENFSLVSRKIAERSAETGEHYITRNISEYRTFFRKALGGGIVTTFTTLFKLSIASLPLVPFLSGLLASLNYSISFLTIQYAGFTLGTKQPAMTAPALAAKMHRMRDAQALKSLVDEIVNVIRSQWIAVVGNVVATVPCTYGICLIYLFVTNQLLIGEEKATAVMTSFSLLGMTPFFAAFTGVLLWISSLAAGWVDNWFAYRQISAALSANRRIIFVIGEARAKLLGIFVRKHTSGIAGNICLAFLLGMVPVTAKFFALPLDVRHVTLSASSLAAAAVSLPLETLRSWDFLAATLGILSMGILNISVAFGLAMFVAIRARKVEAPERGLIYQEVWRRFKTRPLSFFWP